MALISPTVDNLQSNSKFVARVSWLLLSTADTVNPWLISALGGLAGSVQVTGTFGGATITVQVSNDATTWFTLNDTTGSPITFTAAGLRDFSTSAAYIRPVSSGGSGDDVNVFMVFRT